jgi:signal peptidase II
MGPSSASGRLLRFSGIIVLTVLFLDQILKFWVKTHMYLGEEFSLFGKWSYIHFTENYGMAFGMEFGGSNGKVFLSMFRIIASAAIAWYVLQLCKKGSDRLVVLCFSLILAGAIGNIIDSAFYGMIFTDSSEGMATVFPEGGGYAGFLHGRVVDMLYFPMMSGVFPDWLPIWGGESFLFFRPVFNIADSSITIGVLMYILFYKRMSEPKAELPVTEEATN